MVVGTLRLSYFQHLFQNVKMGDQDALILVRDDGSIIMRSPFLAYIIGTSLASSPLFRKTASALSGSFEELAKIDGVKRLYVYQHVGEYPLVLSYGTSLDAIYANWRQKTWFILVVMLGLGAVNLTLIVVLARALRRRTEAEHKLSILAATDSLTGLSNRRRFDEIFGIEWHRASRTQSAISLLMIDADNFKAFNDRFGHQAGDSALIDIAHCIKAGARRATDICARYGGEEFAVLLPGTSIANAVKLAERIRTSLPTLRADPEFGPVITTTISIGAACFVPQPGQRCSELLKAADIALYEAKCQGRNCTVAATMASTPELVAA